MNNVGEQIHVLIASSGEPEYLTRQVRLLRAFSSDDLKIIVVNDANDQVVSDQLAAASEELDVEALRYPQSRHSRRLRPPRISPPSSRNAEAIQFGFDAVLSRGGCRRLVILDFDMFPFRRFSFADLLAGCALAGIPQIRHNRWIKGISIRYPWVGFLLLDLDKLPAVHELNFGCGLVNGVRGDTGGKLHRYLTAQNISMKNLHYLPSGTWTLSDAFGIGLPSCLLQFAELDPANRGKLPFSEIYADCFFHLRGGSNWQIATGASDYCPGARRRLFATAFDAVLLNADDERSLVRQSA
jgi:hypothetical protein